MLNIQMSTILTISLVLFERGSDLSRNRSFIVVSDSPLDIRNIKNIIQTNGNWMVRASQAVIEIIMKFIMT